jgi:hypothetical protein
MIQCHTILFPPALQTTPKKYNHHQLQLVQWDMSYDLKFFSIQVSTEKLKAIAHIPSN